MYDPIALTEDELLADVEAVRIALAQAQIPTVEGVGLSATLNGAKKLTFPALRLHIIKISKALGWELVRVPIAGQHRFVLRPVSV